MESTGAIETQRPEEICKDKEDDLYPLRKTYVNFVFNLQQTYLRILK